MAHAGLSCLRLLGVLLTAVSLLAAPAAGEKIELEQTSVELCMDSAAADRHGSGEPDHEGHEHHQHGCGSCHIHILRGQALSLAERHVPAVKITILKSNDPALAEPSGLFRPPRV